MAEQPKITVIIPVRNEENFIGQTLRFVREQEYPSDRLEIIVVDGNSDDQTIKVVEESAAADKRIKLLRNPRRLSSSARNLGVRNATGDMVLFIDGHVYIDNRQLLNNTVRLLKEKDVAVLSRPQLLNTPDNTLFQRAVSLARESIIGHGLDSTIYTAKERYVDPTSSGATYKRELFDAVGYYDEEFDACEDVEFNYRAAQLGYRSFTSPKLAVFYYPRNSIRALFQQMQRYGTGRFRLSRKHPKTVSLGTLIPFSVTVGLPLLGFASLFFADLVCLFYICLVLYLLPILGWSAVISLKQGAKFLVVLPAVYFTIHFGLGWGFLKEMFATVFGSNIESAH